MLQLCALETFGRTGLQIGVSGKVLLSLVLKTFFRTLSSKTVLHLVSRLLSGLYKDA